MSCILSALGRNVARLYRRIKCMLLGHKATPQTNTARVEIVTTKWEEAFAPQTAESVRNGGTIVKSKVAHHCWLDGRIASSRAGDSFAQSSGIDGPFTPSPTLLKLFEKSDIRQSMEELASLAT